MSEDRAAVLAEIAAQVRDCKLCRLHEGTTNGVPGAGTTNAEIMFIGEGPGFHEDKQGLPFVGRSGDYLNELLKMIGLQREQVFIANVVKHRPPENRDPLPDEMLACKPYLDRQIEAINPLVIATLGRFSMARYFPNGKITQIHGKPRLEDGRAYVPLFHPAAVLRNPDLRKEMEADFRRIVEVLAQIKQQRGSNPPTKPNDDPPPKPVQLTLF
ncbi:MAG TPA: uracil-DNA glycosylase [Phototrophicaceae bacterium]|nr:uracil-DNA glycosylase [Phototrophicaceae bacterium]